MRTHPGPLAARSPARFLPPLLWMGLIALGSSGLLATDRTGRWTLTVLGTLAPWASFDVLEAAHFGVRKLGHLVEYGILAILWLRALGPSSPYATTVAFVLAAAYGGLDELWQGLHPSRTPATTDAAIDAAGALLALAAREWPGPLAAATLGVAAWGVSLAAGLGLLMIALDVTLGRAAADLGLATLGLALTAWGVGSLARLARRARIRVSSGPRAPAPS